MYRSCCLICITSLFLVFLPPHPSLLALTRQTVQVTPQTDGPFTSATWVFQAQTHDLQGVAFHSPIQVHETHATTSHPPLVPVPAPGR